MATITVDAPRSALLPPPFAGGLGLVCFSAGLAGLGVLALIYRDFALQWQPVPAETPMRDVLALANGIWLIVAAAALWWKRTQLAAACALAVYLALWTLVLHLPRLIGGVEAAWNAMAEIGVLTAGAAMIAARAAGRKMFERAARLLFALCLPVFGVAHFIYAAFTASMIPAFIPVPLFWAYFTGVGHIAAGVSLLTNILPRLGATLYGVMLSCFVLLLHAPRTIAAPGERIEWTMLFVALALTGAAWTVAGSLSARPAAHD